jgi:hypothetical protein
MSKQLKKKIRDFVIVTVVLVGGGLSLVAVGTYGDYARHDRAAHHQE